MLRQSWDTLILELANLLSGNQSDSLTVRGSLKLICDSLSFDCGLVYESDSSDSIKLTDYFLPDTMAPDQFFGIKQFNPQAWTSLKEKTTACIQRGDGNASWESELLDSFSAGALIIDAVSDENLDIYGAVILFSSASKGPFLELDQILERLSVPLSILERYLIIRMYQHRLILAKTSGDHTGQHGHRYLCQ